MGALPTPTRRAGRVALLALLVRLAAALWATVAVSCFRSLDAAGPLVFLSLTEQNSTTPTPPPPTLFSTTLTALTAWDGAFFAAAATDGVGRHDASSSAFAPWAGGLAGRGAGWVARKVLPVPSPSPLTAPAAALAASWGAFIGAAVLFDAVSGLYLPGQPGARTAATLLFILNPASPFAGCLYAEAWHALSLFSGLFFAARRRPWASACALALASASRSTGVLGALWAVATPPVRAATTTTHARAAADRCARAALACAPLLLWQAHAWVTFCGGEAASPQRPPWCDARTALPGVRFSIPTPPLFSIQARDWGVGPWCYWELRNLPHFLLAAPTLAIAVGGLVKGRSGLKSPPGGVPAWAIHAHTASLTLLVLTTAHVQVATRLLALGAPGWVWGAAVGVEGKAGGWLPRRALWTFALGYAAVGGFLHATWYPWT